MNTITMNAHISGTDCEGEAFRETIVFTLIPPSDSNHYGTGYHMRVNTPVHKHYVDVRYERTTDIKILADRWIKNYYGQNAREVIMEPPVQS
jgi:hypothetical protein